MGYSNRVAAYSSIKVDNEIIFFAYNRNYICCHNMETHKTECYPIKCTDYFECAKQLYYIVLKNDDWVLFGPRVADNVLMFHVKTRELVELEIPNQNFSDPRFIPNEAKFCTGFTHGEYFYLLGAGYPGILRISCLDLKIELIDDWLDGIRELMPTNYWGFISIGYSIIDNVAIMPLACARGLLYLDLLTLATRVEVLDGLEKDGIIGLSGNNLTGLWATGAGRNHDIITNIMTGKITTISIEKSINEQTIFYPPVLTSQGVFLVPMQGEKTVFYLDSENNIFREWKRYECGKGNFPLSGYSYMQPIIEDDKLILIDGETFIWHIINLRDKTENSFYIETTNQPEETDYWKHIISSNVKENHVLYEGQISIESFIDYIKV